MTSFLFFFLISLPFILLNSSIQYILDHQASNSVSFTFIFSVATLIVFALKFFVDKIFIYKDKTKEIKNIAFFYFLTSVLTTGCSYLIESLVIDQVQIFGASTIALIIGYTLKYFLDKNYVFVDSKLRLVKEV